MVGAGGSKQVQLLHRVWLRQPSFLCLSFYISLEIHEEQMPSIMSAFPRSPILPTRCLFLAARRGRSHDLLRCFCMKIE